ncbi:MAG TPA: helix-turn-helix transcriptional regulator [Alphaproteobacteria bacterium]|nr:helix-turn-helix transcriptional regulator [Alphaproteobacteria bacterium]
MASTTMFAEVAALAGDPARAGMLHALMDGRALTASELADVAGVTPQTASGHLARMIAAELLAVEKQGRHRYYRLASPAVARMMESIMLVASRREPTRPPRVVGSREAALRAARTCYDHLAGRLGVALADAMTESGHVELASDGGLVTDAGIALFRRIGVDVDALAARRGRRVLCRPCLDWSERRPHLAGALGAALCEHCFARGWIRRIEGTRAVAITAKGAGAFREAFGVESDRFQIARRTAT